MIQVPTFTFVTAVIYIIITLTYGIVAFFRVVNQHQIERIGSIYQPIEGENEPEIEEIGLNDDNDEPEDDEDMD